MGKTWVLSIEAHAKKLQHEKVQRNVTGELDMIKDNGKKQFRKKEVYTNTDIEIQWTTKLVSSACTTHTKTCR